VSKIDYKVSAWKDRKAKTFCFFCPQCRVERILPFHPKPTQLHHLFQVALTACFFSVITWNVFGWKGLFSFLPFWAAFEIFYRSRTRVLASCEHCGFDPYIYLADSKKARHEIEAFWKKKIDVRKSALSAKPAPVGKPKDIDVSTANP
jgi:hypothetical protein